MSGASLLWGVLFGSVGAGYAIDGWRQQAALPLLCGVALMVVPYVVPSAYMLAPLGLALAAAPFWFGR